PANRLDRDEQIRAAHVPAQAGQARQRPALAQAALDGRPVAGVADIDPQQAVLAEVRQARVAEPTSRLRHQALEIADDLLELGMNVVLMRSAMPDDAGRARDHQQRALVGAGHGRSAGKRTAARPVAARIAVGADLPRVLDVDAGLGPAQQTDSQAGLVAADGGAGTQLAVAVARLLQRSRAAQAEPPVALGIAVTGIDCRQIIP